MLIAPKSAHEGGDIDRCFVGEPCGLYHARRIDSNPGTSFNDSVLVAVTDNFRPQKDQQAILYERICDYARLVGSY